MKLQAKYLKKNRGVKFLLFLFIGLAQVSALAQSDLSLEDLYRSKQCFDLRDKAAKLNNEKSPESLFYRGAVANKFNRTKESIALLKNYLKQAKPDDKRLSDVYELLADSYAKSYQYAEAAETYKLLLDKFGSGFDADKRRGVESSYKTWSAAGNVSPQKIAFNGDTKIQAIRDIANLLNVPVEIGGQKVNFVFDTGANVSTITASTAKKMGLTMIETDISVGTSTDKRVTSKLGVARLMKIGNITLKNVVFLVMPDEALYFPQAKYQIHGIVGFPVIEAFRQVTITKKDEILIPAKIVKRNAEQNLCLDDLMPLLSATYNNRRMTFAFDTGAVNTTFYPAFYKSQEAEIKKNAKQQTVNLGGAGGSNSFTAYVLDEATLSVSGKIAKLKKVEILPSVINDHSRYYFGNIGQDLIKQFGQMTIDFNSMSIIFE